MSGIQCNVEFGISTAFAIEPNRTAGKLDRAGRSQDLPDA
jgi:hypothetical protein